MGLAFGFGIWVGFEGVLLLFKIGFWSLVRIEVYSVGFSYPLDLQVVIAILFGSDMEHGRDVPSSSEGNGEDIFVPIKMHNHHPQF